MSCKATMKGVRLLLTAGAGGLIALGAQGEFANKIGKEVVGYGETRSTLANFPVLVRIPSQQAKECRADGADIQFTSSDGATVYPHEIDVWNPDGESTVWVKLPKLKQGTTFIMKWGDAAYTGAEQEKGAVWDAAGYAAVWHMTEESGNVANMTSKTGVDGASLDAVPAGALKANSKRHTANEAPIGYARFTGAKQDSSDHKRSRAYLKVADYSNLELGGNFLISGWYYMTEYKNGGEDWNSTTRNARIFSRKTYWDSIGGFDLGLHDSSDTKFFMRGKDKEPYAAFTDTPSAKQKWVHVAFLYDGSSVTAYFNGGATKKTGTATAADDVALPLGIGSNVNAEENNDKYLAGSFDEVRLMQATPGANYDDWVAAEYAMGADKTFLKDNIISEDKPVISLSISATTAREWKNETQTITLMRPVTSAWADLTVRLSVSGSKVLTDQLSTEVSLPAGTASVSIPVEVTDNATADGDLTLTVTIAESADDYDIDSDAMTVTLSVLDDETHRRDCTWVGGGEGSRWADPDNWDSETVPTDIDTAIFGSAVTGDLTVTMSEDAAARLVKVTTSSAVTFGADSQPKIAPMDLEVAEGAGNVRYKSLLNWAGTFTCMVAEGAQVSVAGIEGPGELVKKGPGTLTFDNVNMNHKGGGTWVEEGLVKVPFNGHLGKNVIVGGKGKPATVQSTYINIWNYNPFADRAVIEVRDGGVLDFSTNQNSVKVQTLGQVRVEKGGTLNLGNTQLLTNGGGAYHFYIEGELTGTAKARLNLSQPGDVIVPSTVERPIVYDGGVAGRPSTLVIEDSPDVSVEMTIAGAIESSGWPLSPADGVVKKGSGVLRITSNSTFGGATATTGTMDIQGGMLLLDNDPNDGSATGHGWVYVKSGATLGGTGRTGGLAESVNANLTVAGDSTAYATVHPGTLDDKTGAHIAGTLTAGSVDQSCATAFNNRSELKISVCDKGLVDCLAVYGKVTIAADADTKITLVADGLEPSQVKGGTYTILSATEGIEGEFAAVDAPKGWRVNKVTEKVVVDEVETEVVKALTLSMAGRGFMVIIR